MLMNVTEFIVKHKPTFKSESVSFRPSYPYSEMKGANRHFLCRLAYMSDDYIFFFSQGSACKGEPLFKDVLECLQSDCRMGEMTKGEFANEFGGSDAWQECRECRDEMMDLFGRGVFEEFLCIEF